MFAPWTVAPCQAPLSMEFSRQECCSGLPFPTPGDHPDPEIKPTFLASPALTYIYKLYPSLLLVKKYAHLSIKMCKPPREHFNHVKWLKD